MDLRKAKRLIRKSWEELGIDTLTPLGFHLFVRCDPAEEQWSDSGLILMPPKRQGFWAGMGHTMFVIGTVMKLSPKLERVKDIWGFDVGSRLVYKRLHFKPYKELKGGVNVGWVEAAEIMGKPSNPDATGAFYAEPCGNIRALRRPADI